MRRKIRDVISKPSEALQAMVNGLRKQSQRPDFRIDMITYGRKGRKGTKDEGLCFGCAATCTVQEIAEKDISCEVVGSEYGRAKALGFHIADERHFEDIMDYARKGTMKLLFAYFGIHGNRANRFIEVTLPWLNTNNWKNKLKYYEKYIKRLQKAGY